MANARTVLPTDLPALVSYDGRVYANEAVTLDRLGTEDSPHPIETALEQWLSFATGRHTCVSVKGATLRGLVSARKRGSKQAWEIDCLIDASEGDTSVILSLLDRIVDAAGRSGAMKVFLRLRDESDIREPALRSGFQPYRRETVYRRSIAGDDGVRTPEGLRRRARPDHYPIFQLYNELVPVEVRRLEGMTFEEWLAAQESLGRTAQYVLPDDGRIAGWLRLAGDGDVGRFDLVGDGRVLDALIDGALAKLANRRTAIACVPEHQALLARRLVERGFDADEGYVVMARRTVRPIKSRVKVPAVVQTTFG